MATNEPMTDRWLDIFAREISLAFPQADAPIATAIQRIARTDLAHLIEDYKHLRAREQTLEAENAAMRPVVEAVANTHSRLHCALGCRVNDRWNTEFHAPDCLITQARAVVAAHPTSTAAESEGE